MGEGGGGAWTIISGSCHPTQVVDGQCMRSSGWHLVRTAKTRNLIGIFFCCSWFSSAMLATMSDEDLGPKDPKKTEETPGSEILTGVPAKALEELEERLVKRILSRVAPDNPGEGPSKRMEKGE